MLPVYLNLKNHRVLVIGGGPVGRRKATAARLAGADVRIIDTRPRPDEFLDPKIVWLSEPYQSALLDGAALVFAAATAQVNAVVVADAVARGIWVNSSTDPRSGNFILPASLAVGGLTLAVGTGGAAPALARRVRDRLAEQFDSAFADWVTVLHRIRPLVLASVADAASRQALLDRFADWPWLDRVRTDGPDAAFAAMADEVRRTTSTIDLTEPPLLE